MFAAPVDLLRVYLCEEVVVRLRSGETLRGRLQAFDEHTNAMLNTPEGLVFLKGETIMLIGQE